MIELRGTPYLVEAVTRVSERSWQVTMSNGSDLYRIFLPFAMRPGDTFVETGNERMAVRIT